MCKSFWGLFEIWFLISSSLFAAFTWFLILIVSRSNILTIAWSQTINRPYQGHFCPNWPITRFTLSNTRLDAYISTAFRLSFTSNIFSVRSNHVCYWPSQLTDVLYYGRRNSLLYYGSWNHSANQIKSLDLALDSLSCLPNQSTRVGQLAVLYITLSVYSAT